MNLAVYIIAKAMMLLLVFGLISSIRYACMYVFLKIGKTRDQAKLRVQQITMGILTWLAILAILSLLGYLNNWSAAPVALFYVLILPFLLAWALVFHPGFQNFVKYLPRLWPYYGQTYRIFTDLILGLGFFGAFVPRQMTFLWLNQDYTVGLTAIVAGYVFFGKNRNRKFEGIIWNVFGIILLFNQVFLGYISLPFENPIWNTRISSVFLADFPFVWLWGFTIPFGFWLHLIALYQIFFSKERKRRHFSIRKE